MEELKHKVGLRVAEGVIIFEIASHLNKHLPYITMLSVALLGLVLICNIFEETYFCHLHAHLLACFYEIHLKFLTSQIYFHLDDSELWKQNQSVSQKMMGQICDLETVEPQEVPIRYA